MLLGPAQAQNGSIHYTGQMTPVYTGRSTPYTGQMTPVYTGRSAPYTGRGVTGPVPMSATKSNASIRGNARNPGRGAPIPRPYYPPQPVIGNTVRALPLRYRTYILNNSYYYYSDGYYYQGSGTAAPLNYSSGFGVPRQPRQQEDKPKETTTYALPPTQERFEVVVPPLGLMVEELPVGASQVKKGLYQHRDVYYRPAYDEGKVKYMVSKP
jgi:Family of unknown function (DUF6515)